MSRIALALLLSVTLAAASAPAWADTALGTTKMLATQRMWETNTPQTRWDYVPYRKGPSDQAGYAQIPINSPQYHLISVGPTVMGPCQGCSASSSANRTVDKISPQ